MLQQTLICFSGRFLLGIMTDLLRWQQDEQLYIQDNRSKSGGKTVHHPGFQQRINGKYAKPETILTWVDYKKVVRKWHGKLAKVCELITQN